MRRLPADAFAWNDVPGVAVVVEKAVGAKCARSWKILPTVGEDAEYPDVSPRDAQALREWKAWEWCLTARPSPRRDRCRRRAGARPGIEALAAVRLRHRPPRRGAVTPFFDLVLAWNSGISFGWLQNDSQFAQIVLMIVKAVAVIVLAIWMARSRTLLATVALGLIIGGAIGNAIDRLA